MRTLLLSLFLAIPQSAFAVDRPTVVVVIGAEGAPEYASEFSKWADRWIAAGKAGGADVFVIGREGKSPDDAPAGEATDRSRLRDRLIAEVGVAPSTQPSTQPATNAATQPTTPPATQPTNREPLWLVLIGHGTFDGRAAKFNLRGPDVSDQELSDWLKPARRPVAVINSTSASAPFLNRLSGANRVVIVATRSGQEQQYSRFGDYMSKAIGDASADLDKDGQTSLLEAYIAASHQTEAFYKEAGRLATEHALLDDNGDALGTPATWFEGTRATKSAKTGSTVDGHRAHQWHLIQSPAEQAMSSEARRRRDELELRIQTLRDQKSSLSEADYYGKLEPLLMELAKVYAGQSGTTSRPTPASK